MKALLSQTIKAGLTAVLLLFILSAGIGESGAAQYFTRVKQVIDGDTIRLYNGRLARYIGINTPEIDHRTGVAEAYGFEAMSYNREQVKGNKLHLEFDRQRADRYHRLLVYAFNSEGRMINELLLSKGLAHLFSHRLNTMYFQRLLKAQKRAMETKQGIWKFWSETGKGPYIGNLVSKRFHLQTCPVGRKIAPANRCVLPSAWEAYFMGFSACRVCQPPHIFYHKASQGVFYNNDIRPKKASPKRLINLTIQGAVTKCRTEK